VNDLKKCNILGKVKIISRKGYYLTEEFGEIVKKDRIPEDISDVFPATPTLEDTIIFNSIGNIVELNHYCSILFNPVWEYPIWTKYNNQFDPEAMKNAGQYNQLMWKYDIKGKLLEWDGITYDEEINKGQIYQYDTNGNMVWYDVFNAGMNLDFRYKYKYNGNVIERDQYFLGGMNNGDLYHKILDAYDTNSNLIKVEEYQVTNEEGIKTTHYLAKRIYKYDILGNLIECDRYREELGDEQNLGKIIYKYDTKNNLIENAEYDYALTYIKRQSAYNYENFDKEGNWLKCTIVFNAYEEKTGKDGVILIGSTEKVRTLTYVIERKIEYYE